LRVGGRTFAQWTRPDQREWLVIPIGFTCFIIIGASLALGTTKILWQHAPQLPLGARMAAGAVAGLAFLLDPEAQHFAVGGFSELPLTYGLVGALAMLALEHAPRRAFLFGLLLGVTGSFRSGMLGFAGVLVLAALALTPRGRRVRVLLLVLTGIALPLAPWWIYKWRVFGSPGWDLGRYLVWDGIQNRTWFSLYHLPDPPKLPAALDSASLVARKAITNLPGLLLILLTGPRALWIGALLLWALAARPARALRVTALAMIAMLGLDVAAAAMTLPWQRELFPARVPLEAAGLLATWALVGRLRAPLGDRTVRALCVGVALLALVWGGAQTVRGNQEAAIASAERGLPGTLTLLQIAVIMNREIPAGEVVMSNLGPTLAWHARRPVIHLALAPEDLDACRRRLDFRHVLLVFRDPARAWSGWSDIVARPLEAQRRPELNIARARRFESGDGFIIVWLELGPLAPRLAGAVPGAEAGGPAPGRNATRPAPIFRRGPHSWAFATSDQTTCAVMTVAPRILAADSTSFGATQMSAP
jgi:hypothetical protein